MNLREAIYFIGGGEEHERKWFYIDNEDEVSGWTFNIFKAKAFGSHKDARDYIEHSKVLRCYRKSYSITEYILDYRIY